MIFMSFAHLTKERKAIIVMSVYLIMSLSFLAVSS